MPQSVSDSMTRRNAVAALTATSLALWAADNAYAQTKPATPEKTEKARKACTTGSAVPSPSLRWWITSAMPW